MHKYDEGNMINYIPDLLLSSVFVLILLYVSFRKNERANTLRSQYLISIDSIQPNRKSNAIALDSSFDKYTRMIEA